MKLVSRALIFVGLLLVAVHSTITIYDSTTNSGSLSTQLSSMAGVCTSAPLKTLGLCNTTCASCEANDDTKCTSCNTGYTFSSGYCVVDNSLYNYTYYNYMGSSRSDNIQGLASFRFDSNGQQLAAQQLVSVCASSNYEFFTAGLFEASEVITLSFQRTDPIDRIRIEFYFMSVVQNMKLFITLNDGVIFQKQFTGFSDLVGVYAKSSSSSSQSYMTLDALTTSASSIWTPVDTGTVTYITNQYTLKFYVQSTSSQKYLWGFKDMTVLVRDCQTCVTKAVSDLTKSIGQATWITFVLVFLLIVALFMGVVIEEYKRKLQFQESKGTAGTDLPLKAINRVIESIKTSRKAREKEWAGDVKKFHKAIQKLKSKVPGFKEPQY